MPYQEKMRMRSLPESFTKDSAMVLVKSSLADTTDTSLRHRAHNSSFTDVKFDQSGYQNDEAGGLQKDLFYISPYMTCQECNGLVYVNVEKLRRWVSRSTKPNLLICMLTPSFVRITA